MGNNIRITDRDIMLLEFLAEYKIMSLDNTRYVYGTVQYQEKRIVALVKHDYIKRLKHRHIALGIKGKQYLTFLEVDIKQHCRNSNNIERLRIISDVASFANFKESISFVPSWRLKSIDSPTTHSRRYIGVVNIEGTDILTYSIYGNKTKRYITSLHYDIKRECDYEHIIVFTNDVKELMYRKKKFSFDTTKKNVFLVDYTDYKKFILRNYLTIKRAIADNIRCKFVHYESGLRKVGELLDDGRFLNVMPLMEFEAIDTMKHYFSQGYYDNKSVNIICLEEDKKIIQEYIPEVNCFGLNKQEIYSLINGQKIELPF